MHRGSVEAVVAGLQEDAKAEIDAIERDVATAIARTRAEDAALPVVVADAETRIAAARRRVHDRLAAEDAADQHAALEQREAWIRALVAAARDRLAVLEPAAVRADLIALVREAADRMPDEPIEILVPDEHLDLLQSMVHTGALSSVVRAISRVSATEEIASGCTVQTMSGRIRYDNSYEARARRFEPVWRARLAAIYEQARDAPARQDAA